MNEARLLSSEQSAKHKRQPEFRMRTRRRLEKISTTISLVGLALGFLALGLLIVTKNHDGGASITGGILGILLGAAFLIAACLHWKRGNRIQGEFCVEEVPSAETVSEM
jgi:peptidoglycan/LPS O-acetylase OafA/YrhL